MLSADVGRKLKWTALATAVGLSLNAPAFGQQQQGNQQLEEVTVTGTRIQQASGFTTPVPVTAVTPAQLDNYAPSTTIADQLDKLPQFFGTQSAQRGGGALFGSAGGSYLDLRGMGANRTLILLDGNRVVPADRNGLVNVDNFPTALLRNVEVVTGGASAAYGADALAGVTNFVLNRDYQGLDFSLRGGQTTRGDGQNYKVSLAGGTDLGSKWHMIGSVEDQHINQIMRDPSTLGSWWQRWGLVTNPAWGGAGDSQHAQYLVLPQVSSSRHSPTGVIAGGFVTDPSTGVNSPAALPAALTGMQFTYDGSGITPFRLGDITSPQPPAGNGATSGGPEATLANESFQGGPYGAEVARRNVYAGFTFRPTDRFSFSADVLGGQVESNNINQRGIPHGTTPWYLTIYRENPFLPQSVRQAMYDAGLDAIKVEKQGQVLGQAGNYADHQNRHNEFTTYQLTLGIDKKFGDNWDMQAHLQRGTTEKFTTVYNDLRIDKEFLAIDTVSVDPNTGQVLGLLDPSANPQDNPANGYMECNVQRVNPTQAQLAASVANVRVPAPQGDRSLATSPDQLVPIPGPIGPDNVIPDCTPLNVLGQGNASAQAQQYVLSQKSGISAVVQEFAEVLLNGQVYKGYGPGPFTMAAGATYRNQWFWQRGLPVDIMAYGPPLNEPLLGIRGISPGYTGGSANLHEFSTVPVINGGYHVWEAYTEFNMPLWANGPRSLSLDVAGRYSDYSTSGGIVSWKGGVNFAVARAFRLRGTVSRDVREPTFAERFNLQGGGGSIVDNRTDPAYAGIHEITVTSGGNPNLDPEKADTVTAGFVYQPTRVQGLQISLDTYRVDLNGAVGQLGQQRIVDGCQLNNDQSLCALLRYDSTGNIQNVDNVYLNIANAKVRGNDLEVQFNTTPDFFKSQNESLNLRVLAGELLEDSTTTPGGSPVDNSGMYFEPKWSTLATATYRVGSFGVSLQQRYIPKTQNQSVFGQRYAQFEPGVAPPPGYATLSDATIQSKMYTDVTFSWQQEVANGHTWRASLAIQNAMNVDPPVVASFGQRFSSQTVPDNFDIYGRQVSLNFDYRF
jgi:outer membrane receptor protein involved in Fe transport